TAPPPPPPPPATEPVPPIAMPVRSLFLGYTALAALGLPPVALLVPDALRAAAFITAAIVLVIAFVSLIPLWLAARTTHQATAINALLGAVVLRLMLTAAGVLGYLLSLPPEARRPAGLFAVGWFAVSWMIELGILIPSLRNRPQTAS
ncbi:MAG: hypothetical protein AAGI68_16805, partial [Planctomycetota bacterium]